MHELAVLRALAVLQRQPVLAFLLSSYAYADKYSRTLNSRTVLLFEDPDSIQFVLP